MIVLNIVYASTFIRWEQFLFIREFWKGNITIFILSANNVGVEWNAATILYYVISIASGVLIQGAVFLFFSAISIYFIETQSLKEIMYWNLRKFAGYPISIYNKFIQSLLIFVVPFAFVNYFPA